MNKKEKMQACLRFFYALAGMLTGDYEVVKSCNQDHSAYLVPLGTSEDITYYSKPDKSFRVSDHWNWYANVKKCENENYIQCWSVDLPFPRKREQDGKATEPRFAAQVAMIGNDGKYHVVFGEKFDRKTKQWLWVDSTPEAVIAMV